MRVAILSDIHGNWFALRRVLDDAVKKEKATEVWCLGDTVGYGPHGLECYAELRDLERKRGVPLRAYVAGNNDWGLVGRLPLEKPFFEPAAEWSLRQTKRLAYESKDDEVRRRYQEMYEFLDSSPTFAESPQTGVWLMHGWVTANEQGEIDERANITGERSYIWDRHDCIWKAERAWKVMSRLSVDENHRPSIILAGHTHQPLLWHRLSGNGWRSDSLSQEKISLYSEPVLINPGSVGQPRDGNSEAAYAILDFEEYRPWVKFKRVSYNVQATQDALAGLVSKENGEPDLEAMRTHVRILRTRLIKGG